MKNELDIESLIENKYGNDKLSFKDLIKLVESQIQEQERIATAEPYSGKYPKGPPDFEENVNQGKTIAYYAGMHGDSRNPRSDADEFNPYAGSGLAGPASSGRVETIPEGEDAIKKNDEQRILKLPKLQMSENWGKVSTIERSELERIVRSATSANSNIFEKFEMIQRQMNLLSSGMLGGIKKPQRILSQIMILETMNRLFKSFQPSPAGFINESLLSVFYGGTQTAAGQANVQKDIGDVIDADGIPVSIKTKISGKLKVDGSIENLYKSINSSPKGKVYFDIYEKVTEGSQNEQHVGKLIVSRFVVDSKNINQFLGKNYFKITNVAGKDVLVPRTQFKIAGKSLEEGSKKIKLDQQTNKIYQYILNSSNLLSDEQLKKLTSKLNSSEVQVLINNIDFYLNQETDIKKKEIAAQHRLKLAAIEIFKRKLKPSKGGMDREFDLSESEWKNFALSQGTLRHIEIVFSDVHINKILQQAIKELDNQVVQIFNSLDGFSNSINRYLTSEESGRTKDAQAALEYSKNLEPQTKEVIKTVSDQK